jgi:hypothetical protein
MGVVAWFLLCVATGLAFSQSTDVEFPTPARENVVEGRIIARDLGDARLTQHFYTFTGTPGDLLIKIESANLEGDVDLFLTSGLRPVLKAGIYSGGGVAIINKTAYLKRREPMILRVEARTPDDNPGTYKITLSGAFEPYAGPEITPPTPPATTSLTPAGNGTVRVNSAGARIDPPEPPKPKPTPTPTETVAIATPPKPKGRARQPKPAPTPKPETATDGQPEPSEPAAPKTPAPEPKPSRPPARTKPAPPAAEPATNDATANEPPKAKPKPGPKTKPAKPKPTPAPEGETVNAEPAAPKPKPAPKPPKPKPPVVQTQLILELKDGTKVTREDVRRVTIEKGAVVVITKDGKAERYSLLDVARMSVEPAVITEP